MKKIKNFIEGTLMLSILGIEAIGVVMLNLSLVPTLLIYFPLGLIPASRLDNIIRQNKIGVNLFRVTKSGKIHQNTFGHPIHFFKTLKEKDRIKVFVKETSDMFNQLEQFDNKGNLITYKTKSQPLTKKLLKKIEKDGYITNFKYIKAGRSSLFFEKILFGNIKGLFKRYMKYKMSFNITGKKMDENYIKYIDSYINDLNKQANSSNKEEKELKKKRKIENKNEKIKSRREQIRELNALKDSLLNEEKNNIKKL